jgi:hypothetical protein
MDVMPSLQAALRTQGDLRWAVRLHRVLILLLISYAVLLTCWAQSWFDVHLLDKGGEFAYPIALTSTFLLGIAAAWIAGGARMPGRSPWRLSPIQWCALVALALYLAWMVLTIRFSRDAMSTRFPRFIPVAALGAWLATIPADFLLLRYLASSAAGLSLRWLLNPLWLAGGAIMLLNSVPGPHFILMPGYDLGDAMHGMVADLWYELASFDLPHIVIVLRAVAMLAMMDVLVRMWFAVRPDATDRRRHGALPEGDRGRTNRT